jgi:RNA recognition motif-containing protein
MWLSFGLCSVSNREGSEDANNPGNNLYVTGLSMRVSEKDLMEHFSKEGKVCLLLPGDL